jgi:AraC family transcriptional regulator
MEGLRIVGYIVNNSSGPGTVATSEVTSMLTSEAGSTSPSHAAVGGRSSVVEQPSATGTTVHITPDSAVTRRTAVSAPGMAAEIIQGISDARLEYRFRAPVHLLAVCEEATRDAGESFVEGLPRSTLRTLNRKITLVPAGHEYFEWHRPRTPARLIYFYFEPSKIDPLAESGVADTAFTPRLFFENTALWNCAQKLKQSLDSACCENQLYFEAVGIVLVHELVSLERGAPTKVEAHVRGGLALHQQRIVTAYIEEHLHENISLSALAELAHLSPFHFCRAFKHSFGLPPHRYHTRRRIEQAKVLLANRSFSITEIGLTLGFSETSSFCAAFRKATGLTPRGYRMSFA